MLGNKNTSGLPSVNMHYRGSLRVARLTSGLAIINVIRVEDYLRGVVPREVPSSWPAEALKAQAVAARSYAAIHFGSAGAYDLYCDTRSQAYNGADGEAASTNAAVAATRGVVPTYGGKPITAYFFSTSGGHTENIENVWGTAPVPYLKGVDDPYDTYSPYHIWPNDPIRMTGAAVAAALGSTYSRPARCRPSASSRAAGPRRPVAARGHRRRGRQRRDEGPERRDAARAARSARHVVHRPLPVDRPGLRQRGLRPDADRLPAASSRRWPPARR